MAASSISSLITSLTPKLTTPFLFSSPNPNSISFPSFPSRFRTLTSRFVSRVAVTSEYGQEEQNFSPDLKLFVGNLPFDVTSSDLASLFGDAGTVEMVEVIYDKITGRSRGFAFVTMATVEEVEAAAEKFNGYELGGRPLRVNSGPPPPKRDDFSPRGGGRSYGSPNRVYVGNLSWEVDDKALKDLFSEQGNVLEAKVIFDRDSGRSKGFGFVSYDSAEEVDKAIQNLHDVDFKGRSIRVTVAESKPRF